MDKEPNTFLREISRYNIRRAWPVAGKCALLVIDMQQFFLPIAVPILENIFSLVETCRSAGNLIFFTRHGHKDISEDGGMLTRWWGDCIQYGSEEWKLIESVSSAANTDEIIDKNRYSVFCKTGLDETLRSRNIEELIITGVLTNCCCETTARDGFVRDYRIFFVSDATATVNDELHLASLKNLAYGFAHIVSTRELCAKILF